MEVQRLVVARMASKKQLLDEFEGAYTHLTVDII